MASHTLDALSRSIHQGQLAPAYYFHGPEEVLKEEAVRAILDRALDPGLRDFNFDQRSAAQLEGEELEALCNTLPMLAERRVVVIRDAEAWKRKTRSRTAFLRYLENPSPGTLVILIQGSAEESEDKELTRDTYSVNFRPLSPERASKWAVRHAGQLGLTLDPAAAEHLVRSLGTELGPLASEVAKLASLPGDQPVTAESLGELVGVRRGETPWDWRAAVLDGHTGPAVGLLPTILAQPGISGVRLVTLLGTALLGVTLARTFYDQGSRGRDRHDACRVLAGARLRRPRLAGRGTRGDGRARRRRLLSRGAGLGGHRGSSRATVISPTVVRAGRPGHSRHEVRRSDLRVSAGPPAASRVATRPPRGTMSG